MAVAAHGHRSRFNRQNVVCYWLSVTKGRFLASEDELIAAKSV